jgi:tetratricopeptide (TPR) repeat protein
MGLKQARLLGIDFAAPAIRQGIDILRGLDARADLAWPLILSALNDGAVSDPQQHELYCLESLEIFEELGNSYGIAFSLAILGAHYRRLGRHEEAKQRIEQSLAISRSLGDREGTAHTLRHLGRLNLHQGCYDAARENFIKEYELWSALSLPRLAAEALSFHGEAALAAGNFQEAEAMLLSSLAGFEEIGDKGNALANLLDLAQLALQRGQVKKGLDLLQEARPGLTQRQDSEELARWWQLSGRFQMREGDLNNARNSFERALEYSLQGGGTTLMESLLDFACLFLAQPAEETAARLLGFVQAQSSLPKVIIDRRIVPLRYALVADMGEQLASQLFEEGAVLDRKAIIEFAANK